MKTQVRILELASFQRVPSKYTSDSLVSNRSYYHRGDRVNIIRKYIE